VATAAAAEEPVLAPILSCGLRWIADIAHFIVNNSMRTRLQAIRTLDSQAVRIIGVPTCTFLNDFPASEAGVLSERAVCERNC
jgi:hypothetical protein